MLPTAPDPEFQPLTVSLPAPLADEIRAAAVAFGLSTEEYLRHWDEDARRVANYERTGKAIDAAEVFDRRKAKLKARVGEKA